MFKEMKTFTMFLVNLFLMALSWIFYKFPQGDEYLVIFMIPLVFIVAPYVLPLRMVSVLFAMNFLFFLFYFFLGALNALDVTVLMLLLGVSYGASYVVRVLQDSFAWYHDSDISRDKRDYDNLVGSLEVIDRRGRQIENELNRISRLYEVTKQLAPALKFEDLLNALFYFLEENFKFQTAHLLVFSMGAFSRGISKSVGDKNYYEDGEMLLDYPKVVEYARKEDLKPFFIDREKTGRAFIDMKIRADTFMAFPLFVGDNMSAILAIEGASRFSYGRFRILVPQVALEFRKVDLYEQVQKLSIVDGLTEVFLRRYLMERLEEEVDRARRLSLSFSVGMVDVDHFKQCNDKYGHLVGDAVLKKIAERLKSSVREVDMIARYGGEEFCIVLPETDKKSAKMVAERLRKSIETKEIKAFDENVRMTVSAGISTFPEDGENVATLVDKADTALYKAKRKGRNRVCVA